MDMLEIGTFFGKDTFDAVACFGNTLVHLPGPEEIARFIRACSVVLKPEGKLLIQIINYDRILDNRVKSLPAIQTNGTRFMRNYHYDAIRHRVEFETILQADSLEEEIRNTIDLYPLRKQELAGLLIQFGFTISGFYGSFLMEPYTPESVPLIVTTTKNP